MMRWSLLKGSLLQNVISIGILLVHIANYVFALLYFVSDTSYYGKSDSHLGHVKRVKSSIPFCDSMKGGSFCSMHQGKKTMHCPWKKLVHVEKTQRFTLWCKCPCSFLSYSYFRWFWIFCSVSHHVLNKGKSHILYNCAPAMLLWLIIRISLLLKLVFAHFWLSTNHIVHCICTHNLCLSPYKVQTLIYCM